MAGLKIEVSRLFLSRNSTSKIIGEVDIKFAGVIEIKKCKIISGQDGMFVSPPQYPYETKDGQTKYGNYAYWPKEWNDTINQIVYKKINES